MPKKENLAVMVMICYDNIKIIVVYGESVLGG